eukprot:scaffold459_cov117-Isochrysis_galbana.AAC.14
MAAPSGGGIKPVGAAKEPPCPSPPTARSSGKEIEPCWGPSRAANEPPCGKEFARVRRASRSSPVVDAGWRRPTPSGCRDRRCTGMGAATGMTAGSRDGSTRCGKVAPSVPSSGAAALPPKLIAASERLARFH